MSDTVTTAKPKPALYTPMLVPVDMLVPNLDNPRELDGEGHDALLDSMKSDPNFFKLKPIVANVKTGDYVIIMGHQRLKIAKELGMEKVPVVFVDVDESTHKAWMVKDNLHQGKFIPELLKQTMFDLHETRFDMT